VRYLLATVACVAGLAVSTGTAGSTPTSALSCPRIGPHQGSTTGDYEVVFGLRSDLAEANALLARVKAKGFGCAKLENENGMHEICVFGIRRYRDARRILIRAHRRGFRRARLEVS
jgi:hypothetical protein